MPQWQAYKKSLHHDSWSLSWQDQLAQSTLTNGLFRGYP